MRRFLLVGQTGVGKSSFINSTFGIQLAKVSDFEVCTKVVERYVYCTQFGDLCLVDTPGLAEKNEAQDRVYLSMVRDYINYNSIDMLIYLSRLDDTRFRPDEKRTLQFITAQLGESIWRKAWLILTFAASLSKERLNEATTKRVEQIAIHIYTIVPWFKGFEKIGIIDNVVNNWTLDGIPAAQFLTT